MVDATYLEKCICLHAGHGYNRKNYDTRGTIVCKTVKAKDLGNNACKHESFRTTQN